MSHVTVIAIAQTASAPFPQLLPTIKADKPPPLPKLETQSAIAPNAAEPSQSQVGFDMNKGSAAGASSRDFKPVGRTTAQALVAPSTVIAVGILGGLVALATAGVGGSNSNVSGASATN